MTATSSADELRTVRHVIVDRDGVLNRERDRPLDSVSDWEWESGALDGLTMLAQAGVAVSVATNQSAIGRGLVRSDAVEALHAWLRGELERLGVGVVGVFMCPHAPDDGCECRKPFPGLVLQALAEGGFSVSETVLVGDDARDLDAADAAGVRAVLVRTGKGRNVELSGVASTPVADDLADAARMILRHPRARPPE